LEKILIYLFIVIIKYITFESYLELKVKPKNAINYHEFIPFPSQRNGGIWDDEQINH